MDDRPKSEGFGSAAMRLKLTEDALKSARVSSDAADAAVPENIIDVTPLSGDNDGEEVDDETNADDETDKDDKKDKKGKKQGKGRGKGKK